MRPKPHPSASLRGDSEAAGHVRIRSYFRVSGVRIMASIALHRGTLLAMTVHASIHGDRFFLCDHVAFSDRPMANITSDLGLRVMDAMRKVYEIRKLVDLHPRD